MIRKISTYGAYFREFMSSLDDKTQFKINQGLLLLATQQRLSAKFVSPIREGLYELRTTWNSNIYRIFFIFDNGNIAVLFNGFQKRHKRHLKLRLTKH